MLHFCFQLKDNQETSTTESVLPVSLNECVNPTWCAGESQAVEDPDPNINDEALLCHEDLDSFPAFEDSSLQFQFPDLDHSKNEIPGKINNSLSGIYDLDNIEIDTPPDFQLAVSPATCSLFLISLRFTVRYMLLLIVY